MATELGQAYVQIMPSAKGISGLIKKQLDPEASSAGSSAGGLMGGKLVAMVKGAIATAAIGKAFSASMQEGSKLQQSLGGIETLFKGSASKVKEYANQAYKTTGLSANGYMENVTSFSASLLQSMGGNTAKAADKANMAMVDMSDNANKMGTNIGDIQNAYQGFAKQNYTMLDNLKLGYGGTQDEMKRLLTDATKISGVKYDMSNLSDVYSAIHVIQGNLKITGTTAKEAATTFAGSFDSMKSSAQNVMGKLALGMDIGPDLRALAQTTSTFLFQNFIPMIGNILKALPSAVVTFVSVAAPQFMSAGAKLLSQLGSGVTTGIPMFITSFQSMITGVSTWLTANMPAFLSMGVKILSNIINGILQSLPGLVSVVGTLITTFATFIMVNLPKILAAGKNLLLNLIDGIIANLPALGNSAIRAISKFINTITANYPKYLASGAKMLQSLVLGILQRLPSLVAAVVTIVAKFAAMIVSKLPQLLAMGGKMLVSLVSGLIRSLPKLVSTAAKIGSSIINELKKVDLLKVGENLIKGLWSGISNMASWIKDKITGFGKGVLGSLKSFFKIHSPSRVMRDEIGRYLVEGIGVGIDKYSGSAFDAMDVLGSGIQKRVPALDLGFASAGGVAASVVKHQVQAVASTNQSSEVGTSSKVLNLLQQIADKSTVINGSSVMPALAPFASYQQRNRQAISDRGGAVSVQI
jgi:phage-related protein